MSKRRERRRGTKAQRDESSSKVEGRERRLRVGVGMKLGVEVEEEEEEAEEEVEVVVSSENDWRAWKKPEGVNTYSVQRRDSLSQTERMQCCSKHSDFVGGRRGRERVGGRREGGKAAQVEWCTTTSEREGRMNEWMSASPQLSCVGPPAAGEVTT